MVRKFSHTRLNSILEIASEKQKLYFNKKLIVE